MYLADCRSQLRAQIREEPENDHLEERAPLALRMLAAHLPAPEKGAQALQKLHTAKDQRVFNGLAKLIDAKTPGAQLAKLKVRGCTESWQHLRIVEFEMCSDGGLPRLLLIPCFPARLSAAYLTSAARLHGHCHDRTTCCSA